MCALDGGTAQPCNGSVSYSGLSLGAHLVTVQTTAPDGTQGAATADAWDINTGAPPTATITVGPADGAGPAATFDFTSTSPQSSFTCSLDGAVAQRCTSPYNLFGLSTGVHHSLTVNVTDPYGLRGPSVTWTWTS